MSRCIYKMYHIIALFMTYKRYIRGSNIIFKRMSEFSSPNEIMLKCSYVKDL